MPVETNGINGHDHVAHNGLVQLTQQEIAAHFAQRGGRLFHSHGDLPWPLPADGHEQVRLNTLHNHVLPRVVGRNYVGPVQEVLQPEPNRVKHVVDLGTGTGQWVIDMAHEFPGVRYDGLDIVPIQTRYPPAGVIFQIQDVTGGIDYDAGTIDVVHARDISMGIRNYEALVAEVARILRPGGLFISGEWARNVVFDTAGLDPRVVCPATVEFYAAVNAALLAVGVTGVEGRIGEILTQSGRFRNVTPREYRVPINKWHANEALRELGEIQKVAVIRYAAGMSDLLCRTGMSESDCANLLERFLQEAENVPGMVSVYHTVHATRA